MRLKRIVVLRVGLMFCIASLIIISLSFVYLKIINISEGLTGIGVGVSVISLISYIYYNWFEGNLEEIEYQLNKMYKPLRRVIITSQKRLRSKELTLVELANDIDALIRGIEIESIYDIDDDVMKFKKSFVGSPSEDNLSVFLNTVEDTIIQLKKERKKYEF